MLRLIVDRTRGRLLPSFRDGKRPITLAESWRPIEESSATVHLYGVETDSAGRLTPLDLTGSGDKPSLYVGPTDYRVSAGELTITYGGDDSATIPLATITADSLQRALNNADAIISAGRVDVTEIPGDGSGKAFAISFRSVGSRTTFTATISGDVPGVVASLTVTQEGTASLAETVLLSLRQEKIAGIVGGSWSALSAPTVAATAITAGSVSAASRYAITCGTSATAEPRRWTARLVFSGGTTTLIGSDSSAADVEAAINTALSSTGAWRVRKLSDNSFELEAQAVGANVVSVTDSTVSYWPGVSGTLSVDAAQATALLVGRSSLEVAATIESGTGEVLYRETLPVYSALVPDSTTTPVVMARITEAATAPTVNDDITLGYGAFSLWIDTTVPTAYILVDNSDGAAVWQGIGGGSSTITTSTETDITGVLYGDGSNVSAATDTQIKAAASLSNVDNTADADKPISTATQTALDAKVTGPASAADDTLARFDGTTGKLLKDGLAYSAGGATADDGKIVQFGDSGTISATSLTVNTDGGLPSSNLTPDSINFSDAGLNVATVTINPANSQTITLPATTGTVALTSDITATAVGMTGLSTDGNVLTMTANAGEEVSIDPVNGEIIFSTGGSTFGITGGLFDQTITLPNASGTLATLAGAEALSNKISLAMTGQSLTGSEATSLLDLATTWDTSGAPSAIKLRVTDSNSDPSSLLLDLGTAAGGTLFGVTRLGHLQPARYNLFDGSSWRTLVNLQSGFFQYWGNFFGTRFSSWTGAEQMTINRTGSIDLLPTNHVVEQRNASNAQALRVFNTTNGTDKEFFAIDWQTTANTLLLSTQVAGSGTKRDIVIDGANRGAFVADATNLASALTLVNALKSYAISHGIMAAS